MAGYYNPKPEERSFVRGLAFLIVAQLNERDSVRTWEVEAEDYWTDLKNDKGEKISVEIGKGTSELRKVYFSPSYVDVYLSGKHEKPRHGFAFNRETEVMVKAILEMLVIYRADRVYTAEKKREAAEREAQDLQWWQELGAYVGVDYDTWMRHLTVSPPNRGTMARPESMGLVARHGQVGNTRERRVDIDLSGISEDLAYAIIDLVLARYQEYREADSVESAETITKLAGVHKAS